MVSLADLRARDIVPTWQEAVAVVQELLHTIVATQGSADRLPDLEHIALIANGDVVALPGGRAMTEHPVRHLAQILRVLLDRSSAPPQLQEFVVANLQDPPQIDTVEEFSMQLAFFERPGRRSDVEQLVARALSTEAQTQAEEELRRLKAKALEAAEHEEEPAAEAKGPARLQSRQAVVVAALFAFVLLAGAGWWLLGSGGGSDPQRAPGDRADAADVAAPGAEPAAQTPAGPGSQAPPAGSGATSGGGSGAASAGAAASEAGASGQPVGTASQADKPAPSLMERTKATLSRVARAAFGPSSAGESAAAAPAVDTAAAADAGGASAPAAESAPARRRPVRAASRPAASVSAGSSPAAAAARPPSPAPQVSTVVTTPPVTGEPPMSVAETTAARTIIYTAADEEVLPAILLRPVLPEEPPPDVPPADIGTLELVVNEQGDVERVRLISPSNRFHERMLVAHAKTWKFRPAIRDGRPVKFRTVVRLTI